MGDEKASVVILPCPFCGATPRKSTYTDESLWSHEQVIWHSVTCHNCDVSMSDEDYDELITRWNQRGY